MIITLKDSNSVWVGVSMECTYDDISIQDILHEDNLKMWRVPSAGDCIIASLRCDGADIDCLRYQKSLGIPDSLDHKRIITKVIPKLKHIFEQTDMMDGNESWQNIVIAKGDKAFEISPSFVCTEVEDFGVVGSRRRVSVVYGAMKMNSDLPPAERIADAFRTAQRLKAEIEFPVVIMNTRSKERIVVYE